MPKADNTFSGKDEKRKWRDILIDMLFAVGMFDIHAPSSCNLKLKSNSILDLYFELFVAEVEYLLHNGLVKQYRKKEGNVMALKGSLQFSKHLQQNLIHQERFFVRHSTYDFEHQFHFILYKTIHLLKQINTNNGLQSRIGALLLHFPEMPDVRITDTTFDRLVFTRKTQSYKKAIDIAKLLLLQYHPDVSKGRNDVLALMFDMNKLWETFVYVSLRKNKDVTTTITAQTSRNFWKPDNFGYNSKIRPDIVLNMDIGNSVVLDTKWKNLNGFNPSPDDLRQMFVYHEYYNAKKVALIYPGKEVSEIKGTYYPSASHKEMDMVCSVILLAVPDNEIGSNSIVKVWQGDINTKLKKWLGNN